MAKARIALAILLVFSAEFEGVEVMLARLNDKGGGSVSCLPQSRTFYQST